MAQIPCLFSDQFFPAHFTTFQPTQLQLAASLRPWSTWLFQKAPQVPRVDITPVLCPSLPQCWQPSTSGLLKYGPVFQGLSDPPPEDQMLLKACKFKTRSCVAVRRLISTSATVRRLCRGNCPQKPESLKQSLYRHYQVNRDQSCLLSSFLPDVISQYLPEQYPLFIQQVSHILPEDFIWKGL